MHLWMNFSPSIPNRPSPPNIYEILNQCLCRALPNQLTIRSSAAECEWLVVAWISVATPLRYHYSLHFTLFVCFLRESPLAGKNELVLLGLGVSIKIWISINHPDRKMILLDVERAATSTLKKGGNVRWEMRAVLVLCTMVEQKWWNNASWVGVEVATLWIWTIVKEYMNK